MRRLLLAGLFALLVPAQAQATTYTLAPVADSDVSTTNPGNDGTAQTLDVQMLAKRSYLKFDVPQLDGNVTRAELKLTAASDGWGGVSLRRVADTSWGESTIDFLNAPARGAIIANSGGFAGGEAVSLDATSSPPAGGGLVSYALSTGSATQIAFDSRESSNPPQLVIETDGPPQPPAGTGGDTVYVDPGGSDDNPCTQTAPCQTFDRGFHAAADGGTVQLAAGTYPAQRLTADSTKTSRVTLEGFGQATVGSLNFGSASHVAVAGVTVSNPAGRCVSIRSGTSDIALTHSRISQCGSDGIHFSRSVTAPASDVTIAHDQITDVGQADSYANDMTIYGSHVTVEDNDLTGTPNDAIDMWGDHLTFTNNHIHDISNPYGNHNDAFQTWTGTGDGAEGAPVTDLVIDGNTVENVTGDNAHCLMSEGPGQAHWTIRNNVFRNIGDECMIFGSDGNGVEGILGVEVAYNTFADAGANSTIEFNLTTTGTLADNVFYDCNGWRGSAPYAIEATAAVLHDYNLSGGTGPPLLGEAHGLLADPLLVAPATGDVHLQSGSPAIDASDNGALVPPRTTDVYGTPTHGAPDIGAAEY